MSKTIRQQIDAIKKLRLPELQAKFAEVTGEKTRSPNKTFLARKIAEALKASDASANVENAPKAVAPDADVSAQTEPAAVDGKLTRLEVPELQARYLEVVGRPTGLDQQGLHGLENPRGAEGPHPGGPAQ